MQNYRIGRLKGRFVVTWTEPKGTRRRYRLDALTAKEAESAALDLIRKETLPKDAKTVADLWAGYISHLADRPAATTLKYTGRAVLPHFGAFRPDQITVDQCRAYTVKRLAQGRSKGAVWTELGHLRSALMWAQKVGLIDRAPYVERPQKPAPKDRWLTHAEIDRVLSADAEPHVKLAVILMLTTAGRVSAILQLTWDRVDFDRGQINLRLDDDGPRKGRAIVPINGSLRAALLQAREASLSNHVIEWAGQPVKSIRKGLERLVTNAGLPEVSAHVFRHTAAVHMAVGGIPMSQIAQYLGHSSTAVTERTYARFAPDHLRGAAEILNFGKEKRVG
jgi:integrase